MINKTHKNLEVGDYVRILSNAPNSMWETGYITDINQDGYLIKYGQTDMFGSYGLGIRKQASELQLI